jgi:hypothetical protein
MYQFDTLPRCQRKTIHGGRLWQGAGVVLCGGLVLMVGMQLVISSKATEQEDFMQENAQCAHCHQRLSLRIPREMPSPNPERGVDLRSKYNDPLWFSYVCPHCKEENVPIAWGQEHKDNQVVGSFLFSEKRGPYLARRREEMGRVDLMVLERIFDKSILLSWLSASIMVIVWGMLNQSFAGIFLSCGGVFFLPLMMGFIELVSLKIPNLSGGLAALLLSLGWWFCLGVWGTKTELLLGGGNLLFWWLVFGVSEYIGVRRSIPARMEEELERVYRLEVLGDGGPYRV